ncbi:major facilitator superfamily domain-containing protein [Zychaea mexicana]|uniref:major facilitator superfamily domain-containing protein n=1 Tax=Zychaea mexicana TaxID=64656 RepID=UPI0022FEC6CB|nr:major facilitator superfamily domain-containing protein [Zychaea mexicana]KAI9497339.1 major facilitator superfamily domain-containing protein [Zychaea mexicana]
MTDSKTEYAPDTKEDVLDVASVKHNEEEDNVSYSSAERRLVRKLDYIYVMPCIAILNFLQFFDKSALNYASVLGIKEDTNVSDSQYSWLGSIFYLGYLLYQVPNAVLIQRVPLTKYISSLIILWGLVLTVTSEGKNFSQMAALRFLLGFFEAGIYPCCIMLISTLYRRHEQAGRLGIVYICNGVAMAVGGLIGYGIGNMTDVGNKASWQWIMIILGAVTIAFGLICFFCLIDNPRSRFLRLDSEQERIVDYRLQDNAVVRTKQIKVHHMWEAVREPRFYCLVFASLLVNFQNGAMNTFSSIITKGFGFSSLNAILLSIPSGVADCIFIAAAVWYNRRYGQTIYVACFFLGVAIIGLVLLVAIPKPQVKLVGLYLSWAYCAAYTLMLVCVANNVSGYTKKIFYSSGIIAGYTIGNFIGPLIMVSWQAPLYLGGMIGCMCANLVSIFLLLIARYSMAKINRERAAALEKNDAPPPGTDDLTDREDSKFL